MVYSVLKNKPRIPLYHFKSGKTLVIVYMEQLSDKDEHLLDKNSSHTYINCNGDKILNNHIITYGDIDLNNPEDIKLIKDELKVDNESGFVYHTSFNYENATVESIDNKLLWSHTWDAVLRFKIRHCYINKAPKIIIYKEFIRYDTDRKQYRIVNS